jgi:nucleoside-diphosphate-sugar epimerase
VHVNDVVGALLTLAIDPRAKGEVYNLSSDCTFEQLIIKIASLLCVPEPTIRIPAPLIRIPIGMLATLLKKWIRIPGLDALVLRTRYPANKIESELGFVFSMPMPNAIEDLTSVPMFKRS